MAGRIKERAGSDLEENDEINVVPFIDVMLVLLIIFMVAAPLATVDVNVDLPTAQAEPRERPDKPLFVTLTGDLTFNVGEESVARGGLISAIDAFTNSNKKTRVFLRIDKSVDYEHVMELMNLLRSAGYLTIALVGLEDTKTAAAPAPPKAAPAPPTDATAPPTADAGAREAAAGIAGGRAGEDTGQ